MQDNNTLYNPLILNYEKVRFKTYPLTISASGDIAELELDLDTDIEHIVGIRMDSTTANLAYYRGKFEWFLNRTEVFNDDFRARLLVAGHHVPQDNSFYTVNLPVGSGKCKFRYIDENKGVAFPVGGYEVWITLKTLIK